MLQKTPTWKLWDMMCDLVRREPCAGSQEAQVLIVWLWTNHLDFPGFIFSLLKCKIGLDQWISIVPQGSSPFSGLHGEWSFPHQRSHKGGGRHGRIPRGRSWKRCQGGAESHLSSMIFSRAIWVQQRVWNEPPHVEEGSKNKDSSGRWDLEGRHMCVSWYSLAVPGSKL